MTEIDYFDRPPAGWFVLENMRFVLLTGRRRVNLVESSAEVPRLNSH